MTFPCCSQREVDSVTNPHSAEQAGRLPLVKNQNPSSLQNVLLWDPSRMISVRLAPVVLPAMKMMVNLEAAGWTKIICYESLL